MRFRVFAVATVVLTTGCLAPTPPPVVPPDAPFVIAPHVDPPQVVSAGGPVLKHPRVAPFYMEGDPARADVEALLPQMQSTGYWSLVTQEYGVGDLAVDAARTLPLPTGPISVADLAAQMSTVVPTPDPSTMYLFMSPEGVRLVEHGECCVNYAGFHHDVTVNDVLVPVAFACACRADRTDAEVRDQLTRTISHELVEAATDPLPFTNPAYNVDTAHFAFAALVGTEVGDLCAHLTVKGVTMPGAAHPFQRSWSNAAARASTEPCLPALPDEVYVAAYPDLGHEQAGAGATVQLNDLRMDVGETRVIDVQLFSDGPVEHFDVAAFDLDGFFGHPPRMELHLDANGGKNGDILQLSITLLTPEADPIGFDTFFIEATHNGASSVAVGMVLPNP